MSRLQKPNTLVTGQKISLKKEVPAQDCLEAAIIFSYRYLKGFPQLDEDSRQDFILSFLPYLKKKIKSFKPQCICFEDFLKQIIRKRIFGFLKYRCKLLYYGNIVTDFLLYESSTDQEASPSLPLMLLAKALGVFNPHSHFRESARRRLLLVALRQVYRLTEDDITKLASLCQVKENHLIRIIDKLKKIISQKECRLVRLQERRNLLFLRIRFLEQKKQAEYDLLKKQVLTDLLFQKQMAFNRLIKKIARQKLLVPYTALARILKLSRGSVSSDLARAKELIRGFVLKQRLQPA